MTLLPYVCSFLCNVLSSKMIGSMERWVGKVAVVTGASSGIGKSIATALVEHGLIVAGLARRVQLVQQHAKELDGKKGKLYAVEADVSKEDDVLNAFQWISTNLGPVHVLVNNAGVTTPSSLTDGKTEDWKTVLDLNILGLCVATREAIKIMKDNQITGHIIHINSILGHRARFFPGMGVYCASKHAVTALTETLRQELNHLGSKIKITSLSPGLVETEMTTLSQDLTPERKAALAARPSLKPEDISDAVVYALSTPAHVQVHEMIVLPFDK